MSDLLYFGPTERVGHLPLGAYSTSLTPEYQNMWKGKISGIRTGQCSIEIKRVIRRVNIVVLVCGPKYVERDVTRAHRAWKLVDKLLDGGCVSIALNGTLVLSFSELLELTAVVNEARKICEKLESADDVDDQKAIIADLEARPVSQLQRGP